MDQSVNGVPPLVRTRLALHAATTAHALETVKAELDGLGVTVTRSRTLRAKRERLTEELTAWEYLLHVARSASDFTVPNPVREAPKVQPAECLHCHHPHLKGVRCTAGDTTECGCTR